MPRLFAFVLGIILAASVLMGQDELPKDPEEPMEIEPALLVPPGLDRGPAPSGQPATSELDPERIQLALEKAKKSAASGEKLFRIGIIAKLDAENRALKVVRLEADLANARVELAKRDVEEKQSRFDTGEITQAELETATAALTAATNEAAGIVAKRDKAELDEALLNLQRQKKLLALGSGRKSDVTRAQEKVSALQQKH
jgi:hypothetical protein